MNEDTDPSAKAQPAINAAQVAVLLAPDDRVLLPTSMPDAFGAWVKVPAYKRRTGPKLWWFRLSTEGAVVADRARALSDAANVSLSAYLEGETAMCLRGAFRDGFARGARWQLYEADGALDEPDDDDGTSSRGDAS